MEDGLSDAWTSLLTDTSKDILSPDGPFTSEAWTEALAVGKPLTAHILPTSADADSAVVAGAVGAMVSGMGAYTPRLLASLPVPELLPRHRA
jgi:hypothetical protein